MQVYIKLTGEVAKWYNSLPPRGKSEAINDALLVAIHAQKPQNDAIKAQLDRIEAQNALILEKLSNSQVTYTEEVKEESGFVLEGLESMAEVF